MKRLMERIRSTKRLGYYCLLSIMTVLLIQSSLTLFVDVPADSSTQALDIVVRSTLSSIFGYLLATAVSSTQVPLNGNDSSEKSKTTIGFSDQVKEEVKLVNGDVKPQSKPVVKEQKSKKINTYYPVSSRTQIFVLTAICLYCLGVMIYVRDFGAQYVTNSSSPVIIAQFRELISGCIGALIGISKYE